MKTRVRIQKSSPVKTSENIAKIIIESPSSIIITGILFLASLYTSLSTSQSSIIFWIIAMFTWCILFIVTLYQYIEYLSKFIFKKATNLPYQNVQNLYNHHNYYKDSWTIRRFHKYEYGMNALFITFFWSLVFLYILMGLYLEWLQTTLISLSVIVPILFFILKNRIKIFKEEKKKKQYYSVSLSSRKYHTSRNKIFFY